MLALKQSDNSSMVLRDMWGWSSEAAATKLVLQMITKRPLHHLINPCPSCCIRVMNCSLKGGKAKTVCPVTEPAPNTLNVKDVITGREQQDFPIITSWRWSKYLDSISANLHSALLPVPSAISLTHTHTHTLSKQAHLHLFIFTRIKITSC